MKLWKVKIKHIYDIIRGSLVETHNHVDFSEQEGGSTGYDSSSGEFDEVSTKTLD